METLEIGHLRLITSFNQGFVTGSNQRRNTTAENRLLSEKVSLSLFFEISFENAGTCATNAFGPCQSNGLSVSISVIVNRDKRWNTLSLNELATNDVTRSFRSNHDYIYVCWSFNRFEVNRETMAEKQRLAISEMFFDVRLVDRSDLRIRSSNEYHVCSFHCIRCVHHVETVIGRDCTGFRTGIKTDDDFYATVF